MSKDALQAMRWFRRAAEQGISISQAGLGGMYGTGEGVPQNVQKAYFWMLLASEDGGEARIKSRDLLAHLWSPEQRAAVQADAHNWRTKSADQAKAP